MTAVGTCVTFLLNALGATSVFVVRGRQSHNASRVFLGFAAGVMIAASIWSLLIPAIEADIAAGGAGWPPAVIGFVCGVAFLMVLNALLPHAHPDAAAPEGLPSNLGRPWLLFWAVALHNVPEGMSMGLLFSIAAANSADAGAFSMAIALSIGIGIQNIPEGAAVALPLMAEGMSAPKAFLMGALSGAAEPIFGILVVFFSAALTPYMAGMLAFSAGAMMYVVVEELIPDAHLGTHSNLGTVAVLAGFLLMMTLDIALG
jgi:ZIP family zinc transporter